MKKRSNQYPAKKPDTNSATSEIDLFARGQFLELSDDEKLSAPESEKFQSGASVSDDVKLQIAIPYDVFSRAREKANEQNVQIEYFLRIIICRLFSSKSQHLTSVRSGHS